jgi:hypothetical protein
VTREGVLGAILVLLTLAGGVALVAVAGSVPGGPDDDGGFLVAIVQLAVDAAAFATVGALILVRRPGLSLGWLLALTGPVILVTFGGFALAGLRLATVGPDDALGAWAAWWASLTFYLLFLLLAGIAILFPDGRLPSRGWAIPVGLLLATAGVVIVLTALAPGPLGEGLPANPVGVDAAPFPALGPLAAGLGGTVVVAALAMGAVAVAVRYRRSGGVARQQQKWFLASVAAIALLLPPSFLDGSEGWSIADTLAIGGLVLLPLSIGIAVTRHRLWDIDRVLSRTIGWALVTGVLVAVSAVLVVALQTVLAGVTQGGTLAVAASTLVAFALFQPVRRRVQRAVDRRFDRARYDGERVVEAFAGRLRGEIELDALVAAVRENVMTTVRPASTGLWIRRRRPGAVALDARRSPAHAEP